LVIVLAFILSFSVAVLLPYIPLYGEDLGLSVSTIGYVIAVYQLSQFIGRVPMGSLSDSLGYGKVIGFGGISLFMAMIFYLLSLTFWPVLFLAQIMVGIAVCMEWVTLPSFVTRFGRGKVPIFTFVTGWAYTFSIPLGGVLKDFFGMRLLFILGFVLSIPALLIVFFVMKNDPSRRELPAGRLKSLSITSMYREAFATLKNPKILRASFYSFLMFMTFNIALSLFPLYLSGIGFSAAIIGGIQFARMGSSSTIRIFSKRIENRSKKKTILIFTTLFSGFSLFLVSQVESLTLLIIFSVLWGIAAGLYAPVVFEMIADGTKVENRGKGMGIRGTMGTLGSFIGIIFFSNLAEIIPVRNAISIAGISVAVGVLIIEIYMRF